MSSREQRRKEWMERISDYRSSGLTMAAWCEANNFTKEQLKYWLRKSKEISSSPTLNSNSPQFVPVTIAETADNESASSSHLVVRIGQASIEVRSGFNPQLLREVVQALENTSC